MWMKAVHIAPPTVDPDMAIMKMLKHYAVSSVTQDFTSQRPRSGHQNFPNDLTCRHLEDDAFVDFCENVDRFDYSGLKHIRAKSLSIAYTRTNRAADRIGICLTGS
jgi:hypothetical protein